MHSLLLIALASISSATAQSTTSLFIPDADRQPLVASIVGSDAAATTYAVECVPGTDSSDCGFNGVFTLTEGPSTAGYTMSMGYEDSTTSVLAFTGWVHCKVSGKSAICTESAGGDEANFPGVSTETVDYSLMPVIITDSLPSPTTPGIQNTPTSAASTSLNSASPSTTHGAPTASNTSGANTPAGTSTTTSTSTAGAAQAMITGWVVGAAAVGLAFA